VKAVRLLVVLLCGFVLGCDPPASPQAEQHRKRLLVDTIAGTPISLADALAAGDSEQEFVLAGKIFAGDMSPFAPDHASFTIVELPEPGHSHQDPSNCAFCRRKLSNSSMAVIELVDEQSATIEMPADELLGLNSQMSVMVKGKTKRVGDVLIVQATALHILNEAEANTLSAAIRDQPPKTES